MGHDRIIQLPGIELPGSGNVGLLWNNRMKIVRF